MDALARQAPSLSRERAARRPAADRRAPRPAERPHRALPARPRAPRELHLYPLRLYEFADGVFVVDESGDLGLVGSRLVAVAGMPIASVLDSSGRSFLTTTPSNLRGLAPHFVLVAEVLDGLGIVDGAGSASFTFERPGGERVEVTLDAALGAARTRAAFADPLYGHYPSILPSAPRPLYLASSAKPLWARTLAEGAPSTSATTSVGSPTPALLRKIDRLVRGQSVRRVIVDVRLNGGGDNTTYGPLTDAVRIAAGESAGRLYLLIGRATFSAAANFAAEIDRDTRAIFVGEPTGGGVETYGDSFPSSFDDRLERPHRHPLPRARGPNDRRLAVEPDVPRRSDLDRLLRRPRSRAGARAPRSLNPRFGG